MPGSRPWRGGEGQEAVPSPCALFMGATGQTSCNWYDPRDVTTPRTRSTKVLPVHGAHSLP